MQEDLENKSVTLIINSSKLTARTLATAFMKLFVDAESVSEEIFSYGQKYLLILGIFYPLLYILYIMRASLQGLGNTFIPMVSSFGQLIMRVFCALILTRIIGYSGIYYGEISAWILADIILIVTYIISIAKMAMKPSSHTEQ